MYSSNYIIHLILFKLTLTYAVIIRALTISLQNVNFFRKKKKDKQIIKNIQVEESENVFRCINSQTLCRVDSANTIYAKLYTNSLKGLEYYK